MSDDTILEYAVGIVLIAMVVALIICVICVRFRAVPRVIVDLPEGYTNDEPGAKIAGCGITPLTTPGQRSCVQLELPNPREGCAM